MAHYSVCVSNKKPVKKLSEKDWEKIEQEAVEAIYNLIKKHMIMFDMSESEESSTVVEYDIIIETPKTMRSKRDKNILNSTEKK